MPAPFPTPPFSTTDYPMTPISANSGEEWANQLFTAQDNPLESTGINGSFDPTLQCMKGETDVLRSVIVYWKYKPVRLVSYVCVSGPGAQYVDVAVYPSANKPSYYGGGSPQYQGWNGTEFTDEPAIDTGGYFWYRLEIEWMAPYLDADASLVFYAKTYRYESKPDEITPEFNLWAFSDLPEQVPTVQEQLQPHESYDVGTSAFSVMAVTSSKQLLQTGTGNILSKMKPDGTGNGWQLAVISDPPGQASGRYLSFLLQAGGSTHQVLASMASFPSPVTPLATVKEPLLTDSTHVITAVRDEQGAASLYLDGNLLPPVNQPAVISAINLNNAEPIRVGRLIPTGVQEGYLKEASLWNMALSATEIRKFLYDSKPSFEVLFERMPKEGSYLVCKTSFTGLNGQLHSGITKSIEGPYNPNTPEVNLNEKSSGISVLTRQVFEATGDFYQSNLVEEKVYCSLWRMKDCIRYWKFDDPGPVSIPPPPTVPEQEPSFNIPHHTAYDFGTQPFTAMAMVTPKALVASAGGATSVEIATGSVLSTMSSSVNGGWKMALVKDPTGKPAGKYLSFVVEGTDGTQQSFLAEFDSSYLNKTRNDVDADKNAAELSTSKEAFKRYTHSVAVVREANGGLNMYLNGNRLANLTPGTASSLNITNSQAIGVGKLLPQSGVGKPQPLIRKVSLWKKALNQQEVILYRNFSAQHEMKTWSPSMTPLVRGRTVRGVTEYLIEVTIQVNFQDVYGTEFQGEAPVSYISSQPAWNQDAPEVKAGYTQAAEQAIAQAPFSSIYSYHPSTEKVKVAIWNNSDCIGFWDLNGDRADISATGNNIPGDQPVPAQSLQAVLPFYMQNQENDYWCWAATSTSVELYYNPLSRISQCKIVTEGLADKYTILNPGTTPDTRPVRTLTSIPEAERANWKKIIPQGGSACSGTFDANFGGLVTQGLKLGEQDNHAPGSIIHYSKNATGQWVKKSDQFSFAKIKETIDAGRLMAIGIDYHIVIISGAYVDAQTQTETVVINDSFFGVSIIPYASLINETYTAVPGKWRESHFTKP